MSDKRKEWLLKHIGYIFNECRICAEHHNYECSNCPKGEEACDKARMEIRRLIQQQPEIDKKYVKEKAESMCFYVGLREGVSLAICEEFVSDIISDSQPKPIKIDKKYVEEKAKELNNTWILRHVIEGKRGTVELKDFEKFITQIISDARGLQVPVVKIKKEGDK